MNDTNGNLSFLNFSGKNDELEYNTMLLAKYKKFFFLSGNILIQKIISKNIF